MVVVVVCFSLFFLSLSVAVVQLVCRKRAEAARIAAEEAARRARAEQQEAARRRAAEKKAAAQAEKERAAGIRKAEQERKKAEKAAARAVREAEQEEKFQKKLTAARELAELNERALMAARELKALQAGKMDAEPEARPAAAPEAAPEAAQAAPAPDNAPKPFAGHVVSFTGKLKSMTRPQAVEMVQAAGGKAFSKTMPVGTTLLVVGDTAGNDTRKLEKADEWIGQLRKITEAQFLEMFTAA